MWQWLRLLLLGAVGVGISDEYHYGIGFCVLRLASVSRILIMTFGVVVVVVVDEVLTHSLTLSSLLAARDLSTSVSGVVVVVVVLVT